MISSVPVCILTAGQGSRMGVLSAVINKCLLPYKGKAIISHIISAFPEGTPFVIALGYQALQVREYLTMAHPEVEIRFVEVDAFEGPGTGPGYSLLCCRPFLEQPFYFVSCDTLFEANLQKAPTSNWLGVSNVVKHNQADYCNVLVSEGRVTDILDKQTTEARAYAFTGLMYIHDVAPFWSSLEESHVIAGEHQVSNGFKGLMNQGTLEYLVVDWLDLGTYEKYRHAVEAVEEYDFSKTNEFLYFVNQRVIKFFSNETIVADRVKKAALKPRVFPHVGQVGKQWYSYDFVQGSTLYADNHPQLFEQLLVWLEKEVWSRADNVSPKQMEPLCQLFYREKTYARLADYDKKYPARKEYAFVNGQPVGSVDALMKDMPWDELCAGIPTFIHGDLQFDNILYDKVSGKFVLLDWRQDFAGEVAFGDLYYDLAKLMGGIVINYDYIKAGLFRVVEDGCHLWIDFAQRFCGNYYLNSMRKFIESRGLDYKRVQLLRGLIYLNMSPLHHPPFDQALHALGRLVLTEVLYGTKEVPTNTMSGSSVTSLCQN